MNGRIVSERVSLSMCQLRILYIRTLCVVCDQHIRKRWMSIDNFDKFENIQVVHIYIQFFAAVYGQRVDPMRADKKLFVLLPELRHRTPNLLQQQ